MSAAGYPAGPGTAGSGPASPLLSRLLVGAALRRMRVDQGFSYEDAAAAIGEPAGLISMLENGEAGFRMRDMIGLCTLYGVTDIGQRATLLGLARWANRDEWWQEYRDVIPSWFERYLGLEQAASMIRGYEGQFVPGLLQTERYIRAVLALNRGLVTQPDAEQRVELRLRRQDVLHRLAPARLWVVIDEAVLRRPVGGRGTLRAQIHHLLNACDMPNVMIQVLPFSMGGHPVPGGAITVLRLPDVQFDDVVYLEQLTTATYLGAQEEADYYRYVLDLLSAQAEAAGPAQDLLAQILDET